MSFTMLFLNVAQRFTSLLSMLLKKKRIKAKPGEIKN